MCDPVSMAVVSGASALMQYQGQRQAARQQARYQAQASAAERARFLQEQTSLRMRQSQQQEATNKELGEIALKSREAIICVRKRTTAQHCFDNKSFKTSTRDWHLVMLAFVHKTT